MKKVILIFIIFYLILTSCKNDCSEKIYELYINFANKTDYDIEVTLFPKQEYLHGNFYYPSSCGGGIAEKFFTLDYDSLYSWYNRVVLYYSSDTSASPSSLLSMVFDSILLIVNNLDSSKIILSDAYTINYLENPFTIDSIWYYQKIQKSRPTNECENKAEVKDYTYFIDQNMIENK